MHTPAIRHATSRRGFPYKHAIGLCVATAVSILSSGALADPIGYTNRSDFDEAIAELALTPITVDLDDIVDGTALTSGAAVDGVTLQYELGDVQLQVLGVTNPEQFDTTSRPNFGGTDDGGVLQDGDDVMFSTAGGWRAFGITVSTADALEPADLSLVVSSFSVPLEVADVQTVLTDGASVFFLGLVDTTDVFNSVSLNGTGGGHFVYAVDDIVTAADTDTDGDGVPDSSDNCLSASNADQRDTDNDQIGNACDADIALPNDCIVNFADLGVLRLAFFSSPGSTQWNPDADFNGDDIINFVDLGRLRQAFFLPPGPSGLQGACNSGG